MKIKNFPKLVREVLCNVFDEVSVKSIWFIGSRANETFKDCSDWDFICFIDGHVSERPSRQCELPIDIIQVDSSGRYLLEGEASDLMGDFKNWYWNPIDPELASYKSRITPECDETGCYDIADVKVVTLKAYKVSF